MTAAPDSGSASVLGHIGGHLAFAPVAFAVTDGPTHVLRYANAAFRQLQASGDILVGRPVPGDAPPGTDLTPLLDRAFVTGGTVRDELSAPSGRGSTRWNCTVWPVSLDPASPGGLVIEIRDAAILDAALARQRAITERLLLAAMRGQDGAVQEQEATRDAVDASRRDAFLAAASRDLAQSLDEAAIRDVVTHRALPRKGTWCIVDIVESNGAVERLAVVHPDPAKQSLARTLVGHWNPEPNDPIGAPSVARSGSRTPVQINDGSGAALVAAAHGPENLATLRTLGFGTLLVVPLVVRERLLGAITFVSPAGDTPFTSEEISLASDLADRCAMALDNARLYREADALRAAADVANRAKSAFLGNMSHELMTPLNAIGGYAELLEMGLRGAVTPEQRKDLTRIKQNQQHLLTLISEILNFVRSESGRMEYHLAAVPLRSALNDVAEMLQGAAKERDLILDRSYGDGEAVAWADPDRVRQILLNLVMNALKYSDVPGGSITLTSDVTSDAVQVHVTDVGPGIPPEKLQAIFEPFVQLVGGRSDRQGGVGLGLAISRDLARAMGGDLTVESTVGAGSRFTLTLPRAPTDSGQGQPGA